MNNKILPVMLLYEMFIKYDHVLNNKLDYCKPIIKNTKIEKIQLKLSKKQKRKLYGKKK